MKVKVMLLALVVVLVLTAFGCGPGEPEATPTPTVHPGKAIVSSRCVGCHGFDRVETAKYDQKGWELTVDRMILLGLQLNDEQRDMSIDYLAQAYPKE